MTKTNERLYFKKIGDVGVDFTLRKPFSDPENLGSLLSNIAAIFELMPKTPVKIVDLGCGSGWTSEFYAKAGHDVTGLDISKPAIDAAKKYFKMPNLHFVCSDFDKLNMDNTFDVAVFNDSLHHTDDERQTLKSVYKILKPDGMIIICEPGKGHSKSVSSVAAMKEYGVSERDMPPKLSKKALIGAGFRDIKVYSHPSKLHRAGYKQFSNTRVFLNSVISRGLVLLALSTVMRSNSGIVTAKK